MYRPHKYAGLDDMAAMPGLGSASWRRDGPHNRFHIGDVYWFLGTQREETSDQSYPNIRLWTTNGDTVGFAWLEDAEAGDILVHPNHHHLGIEEEMLDWLQQHHRASAQPQRGTTSLQIGGTRTRGGNGCWTNVDTLVMTAFQTFPTSEDR